MIVPASNRLEWKSILTGKKQCHFEFLAARMTMGRLQVVLQSDTSEATFKKSIEEIREVFVKNINLPKVQRDLTQIFGKGVLS